MTPLFELRTLGTAELTVGGSTVRLPAKAIALMSYAKWLGKAVSKAELVDLLWPDRSTGLHSLNQAVHAIRKIVGPTALTTDAGLVKANRIP